MFKTSTVSASFLQQDDRFKMGGQMFRIIETRLTKSWRKIRIQAHHVDAVDSHIELIVDLYQPFKIYNQK